MKIPQIRSENVVCRKNRSAFMFFYTIALISLIGTALVILTLQARSTALDSYMMRRKACQRNLEYSARNWIEINRQKLVSDSGEQSYRLADPNFCIPDSFITIMVEKAQDGGRQIEVETSCPRGKTSGKREFKVRL